MKDARLLQVLGSAAIVGGALRTISAFIPWDASNPKIEALAFAVDVSVLFGLMGVYFAHRERLGWLGFGAFALAETGIASIVGPDTVSFGIDTYQAGVHAIAIGLALLGIQMLVRRAGPTAAAICWILSPVVALSGGAIGQGELGFFLGGLLFALGFVAAGVSLVTSAAKTT